MAPCSNRKSELIVGRHIAYAQVAHINQAHRSCFCWTIWAGATALNYPLKICSPPDDWIKKTETPISPKYKKDRKSMSYMFNLFNEKENHNVPSG